MFTHPHTTTTVDSLFQQQIIPSVACWGTKYTRHRGWLRGWRGVCSDDSAEWNFLKLFLHLQEDKLHFSLDVYMYVLEERCYNGTFLKHSFQEERSNWTHVSVSSPPPPCVSVHKLCKGTWQLWVKWRWKPSKRISVYISMSTNCNWADCPWTVHLGWGRANY